MLEKVIVSFAAIKLNAATMKSKCFQIGNERQLISCDFQQAIELTRNPDAKIWIDVQGIETDELEELLDTLEVKDLARRLCKDARERSGFYPLNAYIFLVIPVKAATERNVEYITILCRKNFFLTLREARDTRIQKITNFDEASDWLQDNSIEGLLATLMMILSLVSLQQLSGLRDLITKIEGQMDREPEAIVLSELSEMRSELLTL